MAKFLFTYSGGNSSPDDMDAEMAAWEGWFGGLGGAVVDVGNPITMSKVLAADGTVTEAAPGSLSGYSLIEAADGHAALEDGVVVERGAELDHEFARGIRFGCRCHSTGG